MNLTGYSLALLLILFSLVQPLSASAQSAGPAHGYVVIGYVTGNGWTKEQIDATKLTHINYAFAVPAENGELAPLKPKDEANLAALTSLRATNKNLKILISVGGWGGCKYFSDAAVTDAARQKFANSAVALLKNISSMASISTGNTPPSPARATSSDPKTNKISPCF